VIFLLNLTHVFMYIVRTGVEEQFPFTEEYDGGRARMRLVANFPWLMSVL